MISYKKLWNLLIDTDLKKKDLMQMASISTYTVNKLNRGDNVMTDVLVHICQALHCDICDICEMSEFDKVEAISGKKMPQIFPQDADGQAMRWSKFKNRDSREIYEITGQKVFPFIKVIGDDETEAQTAFSRYMKDAMRWEGFLCL